MKQTVEVLGKAITLNTERENPKYVQEVAAHVNQTAMAIRKSLSHVSREELAVMTALELADRLFREQAERLNENPRSAEHVENLIKKIDKAL